MTTIAKRRIAPTAIASAAGFTVYFGVMLLTRWRPSLGATEWYFFYVLSLALMLVALLLIGAIGLSMFVYSKVRHRSVPSSHQLLVIAATGLLCFVAVQVAAHYIQGELPTGSRTASFDSAVWKDPRSSQYFEGDITPRQKMLADVVENVLPGRSRAEIEQLLGPSLDTRYFRSANWDLIYVTGPERDTLFGLDSEWLLIWLDERGQFNRYAIYTD